LAGPSVLRGVHIAYRHRVIMTEERSFGCKSYTGLNRLFARLTIAGNWRLAQFKNDLTDDDQREELEEAVFRVLEPILQKLDRAAIDARVIEMLNLLNEKIPIEMRARPVGGRRGIKPEPTITHEPGTIDAEKSKKEGPAKSKRPPKTLLKITFDGVAAEHGVGNFAPGWPHRVNLSLDDPFIARANRARDQQIASDALMGIALALFVQGMIERDLEPDLFDGPFGKQIAELMAKQSRPDEAAARGAV
jgi:hypothetical protein